MSTQSDTAIANEAGDILSRASTLAYPAMESLAAFMRAGETVADTLRRLRGTPDGNAAAALHVRIDRELAEYRRLRARLVELVDMAVDAGLRRALEAALADWPAPGEEVAA